MAAALVEAPAKCPVGPKLAAPIACALESATHGEAMRLNAMCLTYGAQVALVRQPVQTPQGPG